MKTILRILIILLIAGIVSGGVYALVENTSLMSSVGAERGAPPQMMNADGTSTQPMQRPEGGEDHDAASLSRGIGEVGVLLAKITGITVVILLVQKAFGLLQKNKPVPIQS